MVADPIHCIFILTIRRRDTGAILSYCHLSSIIYHIPGSRIGHLKSQKNTSMGGVFFSEICFEAGAIWSLTQEFSGDVGVFFLSDDG